MRDRSVRSVLSGVPERWRRWLVGGSTREVRSEVPPGDAAAGSGGSAGLPADVAALTERVEHLARRIDALAGSLAEVERVLGDVGDAVVDAVATIGRRMDGLEVAGGGTAADRAGSAMTGER